MTVRSKKNNRRQQSSVRKIRNFLLLPDYQIKLGLYTIGLAVAFFIAISFIIYHKLGEIVTLIVQLTDIEDEVKDVLINYIADLSWWGLLSIFIYIFANFSLSIIYTHKMIGPSVSLKRHVKSLINKDYQVKTYLRKGEALKDLAEELNKLSEQLNNKNTSEHNEE